MDKFTINELYKKELKELGYEKDAWNLLIELRDNMFKEEHKKYLKELNNRLEEEKNKDKPSKTRISQIKEAINDNYNNAIRSLYYRESNLIKKTLETMQYSYKNIEVENEALELALEIIKRRRNESRL